MSEKGNGTKLCKYCKSEIPADAKVCPHCRKKQKKTGCIFGLIAVVIIIILFASMCGSGGDDKDSGSGTSSKKEDKKEVEYTAVTANDMVKAVEDNAAGAKDTYKDKYIELTGTLSNIDSSGKYISISGDDISMYSIQCYIKNDEQLDTVKAMTKGDTITVRGKCTDVGEVLGYSLDIDSIVTQ